MPPIKKVKARRTGLNVKIEDATVDPKELAKAEKSILGRDQAPTSAEVSPSVDEFKRFSTELGPPFDSERMTLKQCRQVRKDPMVAFGLHYIKVPIARNNWIMQARDKNGPNAQVAAFMDAAMRKIYARYVFQRTQALDFGFAAMVKRFILENPGGIYRESAAKEADPAKRIKSIWDEGKILPYAWKPTVGLKPELAVPRFVESGVKAGEFDGINYTVPPAARTKAMGFQAGSQKGNSAVREIDVYHSLWGTNMKDEESGSIYGYPRIAYARDYWWSYRFLYGLNNRAFERLAIPPIIARHPIGSTVVDEETGETRPNWEIALEAAERLRSNAVAAVPSTMQSAGLDGTSNIPEWDFKFLEVPSDSLGAFDARFNYLNVMKLRSLWVPEQAFIEGEGGSSSRNVAKQMAEVFESSQLLLMQEITAEINAYMIPQLLVLNFPEFINNGGSCTMVTHGFRPEDLDFYKQIIQLVGQGDPALLADIDIIELLDRINVPLKDPRDYEIEQQQLAEKVAISGPPLIAPTPTTVGTIANPTVNPGQNNGGSVPAPNPPGTVVAGFSDTQQPPYIYQQPQPTYSVAMMFAEKSADDFLSSLPSTKHYTDKTLRALSLQLRKLWQAHFRRLYPELAAHIGKVEDFIALADIQLADKPKRLTKKQAEKAAKKLVASFNLSEAGLEELKTKSAAILRKLAERAAKLDLKRTKKTSTEIAEDAWDNWLEEQTGRLLRFTDETFRGEVQTFLVKQIQEDKTPSEIAKEITEHFSGFPETKANAIARSETRDAVNAGTLISSTASGLNYVKARDGEEFDEECKQRNGTIFPIKEAWKELRKEHTNGTLGFDPIPRVALSIKPVQTMPDGVPVNAGVYFVNDSSTAYVLAEVPEEDCKQFLIQLSDWLMEQELDEVGS